MQSSAMDRWASHCGKYFRQDPQTEALVLHPQNSRKPHIDMLLFCPNEIYPFYKLCTMGASDYKLPLTFCCRNEFILFLAPEEKKNLPWFTDVLLSVALYPIENHMALTFGHSILWGRQPETDMQGAYLDLPYPIEGPGFFTCSLGALRKTQCLQVTLLTEAETRELRRLGPEKFCEFLYPPEGRPHFLSQRYRTEQF